MGIRASGARSWMGVSVLAMVLGMTSATQAQASAAERAQARKAMNEADALREAGDLRGALEKYAIAHDILRQPTSGLELATTQAALGLLVEARLTASETSRIPIKKDEPIIQTESRIDAARLAAELEPRVPALTLSVTPDVPYKLWIDGMEVPERAIGLRFRTNPGDHVVDVQAEGYQPAKQRVSLGEGVNQLMHVALTPVTAAAPVAAVPPAAPKAETPAPAKPASADPPATEAPAPAIAEAPAPAPSDPSQAKRTRGYVALVAGGAVALGGAVTGIWSLSETSKAKDACKGNSCPLRLRDQLETADTLANIANVALPLGLLGVGYGLYELLTLPDGPEEVPQASRLELQVGPDGAMATLRGAL